MGPHARRAVGEALIREIWAWGKFIGWGLAHPDGFHDIWRYARDRHRETIRAYARWRLVPNEQHADAFIEASAALVVLVEEFPESL